MAKQLIDHDPSYAGSHYALALVAEHDGDAAAAKTEFALATKHWAKADPDLPELSEAQKEGEMSQFSVSSCQFKGRQGARFEDNRFFELATGNWKLTAVGLLLCTAVAVAQSPPAQPSSAGFHHLHLNSTDPPAAIAWYTKTFAVTSRATVAGFEGIATEKIHLLFTRTDKAPISALDSPIWHFGWGSPDMPGDFAMHQTNGVQVRDPPEQARAGNGVCLHERARWRARRNQFGSEPRLRTRPPV